MAYRIIRAQSDTYTDGREITAILDATSDLATLQANETELSPGSLAIVADQGLTTYVLNASGTWVKVESGSSDPNLGSITIAENGTYTAADEGYDGFSSVDVLVEGHNPVLQSLSVTSNGSYSPDEGYDGFSDVDVDVAVEPPALDTLAVTTNGTYTPDTGYVGFSAVVVDVPPAILQVALNTNTLNDSLTFTSVYPNYQPVSDAISTYGFVNAMSSLRGFTCGSIDLTFQGVGASRAPFIAMMQSSGPQLNLYGGTTDGSSMAVYFQAHINSQDVLSFDSLVLVQNGTVQDVTAMADQLVSNITMGMYGRLDQMS